MNKVILIGNLTRDPELTETANGTAVCRFSIAVNRNYTNGDGERETDFFNVTAWRGLGESVARYCVKGKKVAVNGSVQIRTWEDNDGNKHQGVDVIAQDVEFLTPNGEREGNRGDGRENTRGASSNSRRPALQSFDDDGDIPF